MKKFFLLAFLSIATLFVSCSKNDSPADSDIFVGTYKGKISFKGNGESKSTDDGAVTIVKTGNTYYFRFSDGIEDLKGVEFKKEKETLVNADFKDGIQFIRATASSLSMLYMKDGKTWTANAKR